MTRTLSVFWSDCWNKKWSAYWRSTVTLAHIQELPGNQELRHLLKKQNKSQLMVCKFVLLIKWIANMHRYLCFSVTCHVKLHVKINMLTYFCNKIKHCQESSLLVFLSLFPEIFIVLTKCCNFSSCDIKKKKTTTASFLCLC